MKKKIKKFIDRIIEKAYTKRFPDRCGRFPLPDLIRVNTKRFNPITLIAECVVDEREFTSLENGIIQDLLIEKIIKSNDFSKFVNFQKMNENNHILVRAELIVLKSEGEQ